MPFFSVIVEDEGCGMAPEVRDRISPLKYFLEWSLMARIAQIVSTARQERSDCEQTSPF